MTRNMRADSRQSRWGVVASFGLGLLAVTAACGGHHEDAPGSNGGPPVCDRAAEPFDFPFTYRIADDFVYIRTKSGGEMPAAPGPWGGHAPGIVGHAEGKSGADWEAYYALSPAGLTELENHGSVPGVCEAEDVCGMTLDELAAGIIEYTAVSDGMTVQTVTLSRLDDIDAIPFTDQVWTIEVWNCSTTLIVGHVQRISEPLRQKMIAAGYVDPATVTTPSGNLITGDPVVLDRGDAIGEIQVRASPIAGHPGYYQWGELAQATPWNQIEFSMIDHAVPQDELSCGRPETMSFPVETQKKLEQVMLHEYLRPDDWRYGDSVHWLTAAEMVLHAAERACRQDYTSILADLGAWWERSAPGCSGWNEPGCDFVFSIWPIHTESTVYDPSEYVSPEVRYLVQRTAAGASPQYGEVLEPSLPDLAAGTFTIAWHVPGAALRYQGVAYRADPEAKHLLLRWGTEVDSAAAVVMPAVPVPGDACDGVVTTCHDHINY
jgi:hypothetical protein